MKISQTWLAVMFCAVSELCMAYAGATHEQINEFVLKSHLVYLDDILMNQLGYPDGIETIIDGKELIKWLRDGGSKEDDPWYRGYNHFLDPTGTGPQSRSMYLPGAVPADDWALNIGSAQNSGIWFGNMSWPAAAENFEIAVTGRNWSGNEVASTKAQRDTFLAKSFQALGQVMHLVEDVSVPAHTREDIHLFPEPYEYWCNKNPEKIGSILNGHSDYFLPPPSSIGALADVGFAPISRVLVNDIRGLFDDQALAGQYCGPDSQGLAEYTNCNFASSDTLYNSQFYTFLNEYQYPNYSQLTPEGVDSTGSEVYSYRTMIDEHRIKINPYVVEVT